MRADPLSFRVNVLWRAVIPIALVALVIGATLVSLENRQCRSACEKRGFYDHRYTPPGRAGSPHMCHCLTRAESEMKTIVPKGTPVSPWAQ
jgi:hypothetical protein